MSRTPTTTLRGVVVEDLDTFFAHMQDAEAVWMAAFTPPDPTDRSAFDAHWNRILGDATVLARSIVTDGAVAGHIASFDMLGDREITYWIDRDLWGRGVATAALRAFLDAEVTRPLHARAAADNIGSLTVLERCGFVRVGTDRGFATARNTEIEEVVMRLDAPQGRDRS
ncbi:MAG TPA: GNAT family N-acetyltransferase [Acidimicrobiia bacterium]|nr:GNAT family N-acetyltransferase [Acidimicrobiia bacterium]